MKPFEVDVTAHYMQDADSCQDVASGNVQSIAIQTMNGGNGTFLVIETERWAIDGTEKALKEFCNALRDALKRSKP